MKVIKEEESREIVQTIEFESLAERKTIQKKMEKDGWEDLDMNPSLLIVKFRKYIDIK